MTSGVVDELLRACAEPVEPTGPNVPALLAALTRAGQVDTAISGADAVIEPGPRIAALCAIARVLAGRDPSGELVRTALHRSGDVPDPWSRAEARRTIAVTAAICGDVDEALITADTIGFSEHRITALARISRRLSAAARPGRAHEIAVAARRQCERVEYPGREVTALTEVAIALAAAGDVDTGTDVAGDLGDPWARAEALTGIAVPLARAGATGRAQEIAARAVAAARDVPYLAWRSEALAAVADLYFRTGNLDVAVPLARGNEDPLWRADALLRGAARLLRTGPDTPAERLADEALTSADGIGHAWWNPAALAAYAAALASTGQVDRARRAAARAGRPEPRARVLTRIAHELPREDGDGFESLAAELLDCCRRMADPVAARRASVDLLTAWPGLPGMGSQDAGSSLTSSGLKSPFTRA
ncbi:hypothetical protein BZB76_6411 [Actinomadura pelletieri DSM 43383]|uniref:Uncharacterized protein n=1 Tax=Actinomadura pelletieri DSM 43383 TaxID=1120940 RepID=A0A495Q9J3_9ACTN|nr:hypothetical protein [Actinomadura pelletieri]RKS68163.1 hypothetical protein BZB76_6411 [Actinomadura pelletieri DSM 43383]